MKIIFKILVSATLFSLYSNIIKAQASGISANKLTLISASVLEKGSFEFEPAFSVFNANKIFNESGRSSKLDAYNISSSFDFRFTVGLTENLEIGTSLASSIEEINFGAKYLISNNDKIGFAFSGGLSLPAGNRSIADSSVKNDFIYTTTLGPSISYNFSEASSIDVAVGYTTVTGDFDDQVFGGIGYGYLINDNFQLIFEVTGFACIDDNICSSKISIFPGFTYDIIENFSFALGFQQDLVGKNEEKGFGYFGAFTITFN